MVLCLDRNPNWSGRVTGLVKIRSLTSSSFSKTLEIVFRREMGRWLTEFRTSLPGLGSIIIIACFHLDGKYSILMHWLNMLQSLIIVGCPLYLKAQLVTPSEPGALRFGRRLMVSHTSPGEKNVG